MPKHMPIQTKGLCMRFVHNLILLIVISIASLTVVACVSTPTKEEIAKADYGNPPPENYEEFVRVGMQEILIDPYSAVYRFGQPSKGLAHLWKNQGGHNNPGGWNFGYLLAVGINSKNRMGGYTGEKAYRFFFKNGGG